MHHHPMQEIRTFFADHSLPYKSENENENGNENGNENRNENENKSENENENKSENEDIENIGNNRRS